MTIPISDEATEHALSGQAVAERYKGVRGRQVHAAVLLAELARRDLPSVSWIISDIGIQPTLEGQITRGELDAPAAERNRMKAAAFEVWAAYLDVEATTREWSDGTLELIVRTRVAGVEVRIFTALRPAESDA